MTLYELEHDVGEADFQCPYCGQGYSLAKDCRDMKYPRMCLLCKREFTIDITVGYVVCGIEDV